MTRDLSSVKEGHYIDVDIVDAFVSKKKESGNRVGVCFLDGEILTEKQMQQIAYKNKCSTTAFIFNDVSREDKTDLLSIRVFNSDSEVTLNCSDVVIGAAHKYFEKTGKSKVNFYYLSDPSNPESQKNDIYVSKDYSGNIKAEFPGSLKVSAYQETMFNLEKIRNFVTRNLEELTKTNNHINLIKLVDGLMDSLSSGGLKEDLELMDRNKVTLFQLFGDDIIGSSLYRDRNELLLEFENRDKVEGFINSVENQSLIREIFPFSGLVLYCKEKDDVFFTRCFDTKKGVEQGVGGLSNLSLAGYLDKGFTSDGFEVVLDESRGSFAFVGSCRSVEVENIFVYNSPGGGVGSPAGIPLAPNHPRARL